LLGYRSAAPRRLSAGLQLRQYSHATHLPRGLNRAATVAEKQPVQGLLSAALAAALRATARHFSVSDSNCHCGNISVTRSLNRANAIQFR
jgi:hypothetical protein